MPQPPKLRVIKEREGNPGHRPIRAGVVLPPGVPAEPDWTDTFPLVSDARNLENARCRSVASETWRWLATTLGPAILSDADRVAMLDLCRLIARIDDAERQVSLEGLTIRTERGVVKNPLTTELNSWRAALWSAMRDYGLTALARDRLNPRDGDRGDHDALFDRATDTARRDP